MTEVTEDLSGRRMNDLALVRIEEPPTEKLLRHLSAPVAVTTLSRHGIPEKMIDVEEGALKRGPNFSSIVVAPGVRGSVLK
jgi:hypothetical protein